MYIVQKLLEKNQIQKFLIIVALIVLTTIILFFVSATSPIRDINYLNYDSTIFYIIGRGIKYGKTPYIDLVDHKGIYIFLINYFASVIGETNHIGLFVIHLLISYFTVIVLYGISYHLTKIKFVSALSSISILILHNIYFFSHGGIKCETFLAPFLYLSMYLLLTGKSDRNMFITGICAGVVLFTKANLILFFVPIIFYYIYLTIINKKYFNIIRLFFSGLAGVFIGVLPGLIYCLANNCLKEMIYYSFTLNFVYSNDLQYNYKSIFDALYDSIECFLPLILCSILSIIPFYKLTKNKVLLFFYILLLICNLASTLLGLRPYTYYANPLLTHILFVFIYVYYQINNYLISRDIVLKISNIIILILLLQFSYFFSWPVTFRNYRPQNIVAKQTRSICTKIFEGEKKSIHDTSILVVGACINIYNEFNIFPKIKYFDTPTISRKYYAEPYDEIIENLQSKNSEFVVISFTPLMLKDGFNEEVRKILKENYTLMQDFAGLSAELYHVNQS